MEEYIMKLVGLHIKGLYGYYSYDVFFNSDVTFIYGSNGCGKTTVLNITENIITGQIFKLFDYKFNSIILKYAKSTNLSDVKDVEIYSNKINLKLIFNNENYIIERLNNSDEDSHNYDRTYNDKTQIYFVKYSVLDKIKKTFNYVYLPLNRSVVFDDDYGKMYRRTRSRIIFDGEHIEEPNARDITMIQVESIIRFNVNRMNSDITEASDNFRNVILKSLLDVNNKMTLDKLVADLIKQRDNEIQQTQNEYIKLLNDLNLIDEKEKKNYNRFFEKIILDFNNSKNNSEGFSADFVLRFSEILKIKNLVNLAENFENKKAMIKRPIDTFLNTMNEFVSNSDDEKKIEVDSMGQIYFTTKYSKNPISIHYLSSGEKQLITFFTHLIFNVKKDSAGIFVVDEPELSLHLSWQKIFVEKMLEINSNIQLVFATHSPEIIGKNRNKMFKLEKKYISNGEESYVYL